MASAIDTLGCMGGVRSRVAPVTSGVPLREQTAPRSLHAFRGSETETSASAAVDSTVMRQWSLKVRLRPLWYRDFRSTRMAFTMVPFVTSKA